RRDDLIQSGLPLKDDQGSDPLHREDADRRDDGVDHLGHVFPVEQAQAATPESGSELFERVTQFGIEQDDDSNRSQRNDLLEQPVERIEVEPVAQQQRQQEGSQTSQYLKRACAARQKQQAIDQIGDDQDIGYSQPCFA